MINAIGAVGTTPVSFDYSFYSNKLYYKRIINEFLEEYPHSKTIYPKELINENQSSSKLVEEENSDKNFFDLLNIDNTDNTKNKNIKNNYSDIKLGPPLGLKIENFDFTDYYSM